MYENVPFLVLGGPFKKFDSCSCGEKVSAWTEWSLMLWSTRVVTRCKRCFFVQLFVFFMVVDDVSNNVVESVAILPFEGSLMFLLLYNTIEIIILCSR